MEEQSTRNTSKKKARMRYRGYSVKGVEEGAYHDRQSLYGHEASLRIKQFG
jgi:hypothetical protein